MLAIFGALLTGLAPFIIAFTQISYTYILIAPFLSVLPLIAIYTLCLAIKYNVLKLNATKKALYCLGAAGVWVLFAVIYILAVPSFIIALLPKLLICLVSGWAVICSVLIISRTEKYTEQLNGIIGFRNFITLAEKDRLEKLVADTRERLDVIERKIQAGDNRHQLIEQYTNLEHLDRETVEKLIDYILVGKKDPVTKEVPVEIHWNF